MASCRSLSDVPDILYHVFSYLDPVHQFQHEYDQVCESRRSLALAARTCRGFAGPALDVLWKRLPDDQPLADLLCEVGIATREADEADLKLPGTNKPGRYQLPNRVVGPLLVCYIWHPGAVSADAEVPYEQRWRLSRGYDIRYVLQDINDPRTHPGWPRFMEYASRVRAITLFAFDGPGWCGIWEHLRCRSEGAPILPKLQSVAFCAISTHTFTPGALALVSSSVRKVNLKDIGRGDASPALDEKLRRLFSQSLNFAPNTDQLRLEIPPSRLSSPLLQIHCSRIQHLEVFLQLTFDELRILTNLSALQRLSISLVRENFPETNPTLTFKSVTKLDVEGTWTNLRILLDTVHLPSMHTLSVSGWQWGEPAAKLAEGAIQCFRTISARHTSLTSLSICELTLIGRAPPPQGCAIYGVPLVEDSFEAPFLDVVQPLLSLHTLRHLSLSLPTHYDLACTAADLRAVAEAFRALEALHLCIYRYPERPRGGPLNALAHFARNCPRLRLLHLPAMEMAEDSLAALGDNSERDAIFNEPHGLRTLIIPKVLVPPGRADLFGRVSEVVKGVFPLAASPFRQERLEMQEDWAVVDGASKCPDPECSPARWKLSTFS